MKIEIQGSVTYQNKVKTNAGRERLDLIVKAEDGGHFYVQSRKDTYHMVQDLQPDCSRVFVVRNEFSRRKLQDGKNEFYYNNLILEQVYR